MKYNNVHKHSVQSRIDIIMKCSYFIRKPEKNRGNNRSAVDSTPLECNLRITNLVTEISFIRYI
jgi:hypothetical protein